MVRQLAEAFQAMSAEDWNGTLVHLSQVMADHERIGGSRAQRDLVELTFLNMLLKMGRGEDARLWLTGRRPMNVGQKMLQGLAA